MRERDMRERESIGGVHVRQLCNAAPKPEDSCQLLVPAPCTPMWYIKASGKAELIEATERHLTSHAHCALHVCT